MKKTLSSSILLILLTGLFLLAACFHTNTEDLERVDSKPIAETTAVIDALKLALLKNVEAYGLPRDGLSGPFWEKS